MNLSLQLLFHGAIVLLVGLLVGIPYGSAINQKKDEEIVRAWKVAHSGLSMGGTTMIARQPVARVPKAARCGGSQVREGRGCLAPLCRTLRYSDCRRVEETVEGAIAAAINQLDINAIALAILVWSSIISGYGFCIALPYGAWVGHRGLSVGKTIENKIVDAGNIVGATGSLISTLALIFGCLQSMAIFS